MQRVIINKLGPIDHCDFIVNDFMVFTGPQASGKSTIAKTIFFFKNIKNLVLQQVISKINRIDDNTESNATIEIAMKKRLIKQLRSVFLQTFGSSWSMDKSMSIRYYYSDDVYVKISLTDDLVNPNYIWIELSDELSSLLASVDKLSNEDLVFEYKHGGIRRKTESVFMDDSEIIYIPAGRSMMTLFSSQLMYMYSVMNDEQKRSLDYCTQNYLERIMQLKPSFSGSIQSLIKDKIDLTDEWINVKNLRLCESLMSQILQGEYRNIDGEERLQVATDKYVKINYASSGQQEAVWILNVVFYYLLNHRRSYFIIEEPESHLYPNAQKLIAEFISLARDHGNKVLVTTHSPYILGAFNNMMYAGKISDKVDRHSLNEIICEEKWLNYEEMSAYYVERGVIQSCMDDEFRAIKNEVIDDASSVINDDFDKMLTLQSKNGVES